MHPPALTLSTVLWRGLRRHCPHCGKASLFTGYLRPVDTCPECGEDYVGIRADDGPAWLTIIIVGHLLAPLLLASVPGSTWVDWVHMLLWPSVALFMTLALLPCMKGAFLALLWWLRRKKAMH